MMLNISCKNFSTNKLPPPVSASIRLGDFSYNCGAFNPCYAVLKGYGLLKIIITGNTQFPFSQTYTWDLYNVNNPGIIVLNGTSIHSQPHTLSNDGCVNIDVPNYGDYMITAYYIEHGDYNNSSLSCSNPLPNKCFRWMRQMSISGGIVPSCMGSPAYFINVMDPAGFAGNYC